MLSRIKQCFQTFMVKFGALLKRSIYAHPYDVRNVRNVRNVDVDDDDDDDVDVDDDDDDDDDDDSSNFPFGTPSNLLYISTSGQVLCTLLLAKSCSSLISCFPFFHVTLR